MPETQALKAAVDGFDELTRLQSVSDDDTTATLYRHTTVYADGTRIAEFELTIASTHPFQSTSIMLTRTQLAALRMEMFTADMNECSHE